MYLTTVSLRNEDFPNTDYNPKSIMQITEEF